MFYAFLLFIKRDIAMSGNFHKFDLQDFAFFPHKFRIIPRDILIRSPSSGRPHLDARIIVVDCDFVLFVQNRPVQRLFDGF